MKTLISSILVVLGTLSLQAGGFHSHGHHWGQGPSVSFYYGASPYYSSWHSYPVYPRYSYYAPYGSYPAYSYDSTYTRPNYAVSGTLLGALTGGLIGNSIHHQGWEGAGIGAAAGLLLGGLAEHNVRAQERSYAATPVVSSGQPNAIPIARAVNDAPAAPVAPQVEGTRTSSAAYRSAGAMGSANSLFGR